MKSVDLAYAAGIIDGEGYVGIKKDVGTIRRGRSKSPIYNERISVKMISKEALEHLARCFGGSVSLESRIQNGSHSFKSNRPLYRWQVTNRLAAKAIHKIRQYLLVKQPEAELVMLLRQSKQSKKGRQHGNGIGDMDPAVIKTRDLLWRACKRLHNNRGGE